MEIILGISAGFAAIGFYVILGRYYIRRHASATLSELIRDSKLFSLTGKLVGLIAILLNIYFVFFLRTISEVRGLVAVVVFAIFVCIGFSAMAFSINLSSQTKLETRRQEDNDGRTTNNQRS